MRNVFLALVLMINMVGCSNYNPKSADIVVSSYVLKFIVDKLVPEDINVSYVTEDNVSEANSAQLVMYIDKDYDDTLASVSNAVEIYPLLYSKHVSPIFWVSPKQMITASEVVYSQILNTFPEYKNILGKNYTLLFDELQGLDNQFTSVSENITNKKIAIYENSFEHLTDYGFTYVYLSGSVNEMLGNKDMESFLTEQRVDNVVCYKTKKCTYESLGISTNKNIVELNVINQKPTDGNYFSAQYKNVLILENEIK